MYRTLLITGVVFLSSITGLHAAEVQPNDGPARKLVNSQGCKACHTLEGDGGSVAGSFEDMRANLTRAEIRLKLVSQNQKHGNSTISDFGHLSEEDIDALVNFIQPLP